MHISQTPTRELTIIDTVLLLLELWNCERLGSACGFSCASVAASSDRLAVERSSAPTSASAQAKQEVAESCMVMQ